MDKPERIDIMRTEQWNVSGHEGLNIYLTPQDLAMLQENNMRIQVTDNKNGGIACIIDLILEDGNEPETRKD